MKVFKNLFVFLIFFLSSGFALAAAIPGQDFPYARISLNTPPLETPFPWLGTYFSTQGEGTESLMVNPALLSRIKHADSTLAVANGSISSDYLYKMNTEDKSLSMGTGTNMSVNLFFTGDRTVTTLATREQTSHNYYSTKATGINFKQGLKVNDWLSVGLIERSGAGAEIDLAGEFGVVNTFNASFLGASLAIGSTTSIAIGATGNATLTITPEGSSTGYTKTLDFPLWSGFTTQKSTVPYTAIVEATNNVSINAPCTFGGSGRWDKLAIGVSLTPVSADCNINNSVRGIVNSGTPDIVFYQPNIDPTREASIVNWFQDQNQYGTEVGYKKNIIHVPAGETIAEVKYKGFYKASATRFDLGALYNLNDNVTFGLALENVTGATLNFQGKGLVSYANSRIASLEAPALDPTKPINWSPFSDTFTSIEGTAKYVLEEQLSTALPKKIRVGVSFHQPFLIALDYENNTAPIKIKYDDRITKTSRVGVIDSHSTIKLGLESSVFRLPWVLRAGLSLMLKPNLSNFDATTQDQIDKAFKYGVLPSALEMSNDFNFWGTIAGFGGGFNLSPLLAYSQLDSSSQDLNKVAYYDIYLLRDAWRLNYLAVSDPGATAAAYFNRSDQSNTKFSVNHLRFIQTLTLGYRF